MLQNNTFNIVEESSPKKKEEKSVNETKEIFDLSEQIYSKKIADKDHIDIKKLKAIMADLQKNVYQHHIAINKDLVTEKKL